MTSFFPDHWLDDLPEGAALLFCRYTQLGLLRLLTNNSVMGDYAHTIQDGWKVYDRWLSDTRLQFHPEPRTIDAAFRQATAQFASQRASKWIGDCYLLAFAKEAIATLVTFDRALAAQARKDHVRALIPSRPEVP